MFFPVFGTKGPSLKSVMIFSEGIVPRYLILLAGVSGPCPIIVGIATQLENKIGNEFVVMLKIALC